MFDFVIRVEDDNAFPVAVGVDRGFLEDQGPRENLVRPIVRLCHDFVQNLRKLPRQVESDGILSVILDMWSADLLQLLLDRNVIGFGRNRAFFLGFHGRRDLQKFLKPRDALSESISGSRHHGRDRFAVQSSTRS